MASSFWKKVGGVSKIFKDQWNPRMLPGSSMYYFSYSQAYSEALSQINFEGCMWFTLLNSWLFFFPKIVLVLWKKPTNALCAKREHGSVFREEKLHGSLRLFVIFDNSVLDTEPENISLSHTMGSYGLGSGKRRNCVWKDLWNHVRI